MAKMNDYPSVDNTAEFTQEQKAAFLGSAMCIATGSKTVGGNKVTANIPLSDITPVVPTKLSDLTDDITVDDYDATSGAPISGKGVASALANFGGFHVTTLDPATHLPVVSGTPDQKKIYLTQSAEPDTNDVYDEWICTDATVPTWEKVGVTRVELSQYVQKSAMGAAIVYDQNSGGICVNYDDTKGLTLVGTQLAVSFDVSTIVMGKDGLEVANPVPSIDNVNNGYLLTKTANGIQWNELDRTNIVRAGAGIEVYGTAGYPERVSVINPVPTPAAAHADVGKVLTVQRASAPDDSDEIVWAAQQGGLPTIPSDYSEKYYVLGINESNGTPQWFQLSDGSGGSIKYITA